MTLLRNGFVVTAHEPSPREPSDIRIHDTGIADLGQLPPLPGEEVVELDGGTVGAGLIDLQCNGALGIDLLSAPERMWELAAQLPRWGVTAWAPTIISSSDEVVDRAINAVLAGPASDMSDRCAQIVGLHLEGPCLNQTMAGAHPRSSIRLPAEIDISRWTRDVVALVTLAPEVEGALPLISELRRRGITVSVGHSAASREQAQQGFDAGATMATHLFNAMSPLHHRAPGVVGAVLAHAQVRASLICDGIHVDPDVVAISHRLLGERLVLVSDAVAALGLAPGEVMLGGLKLTVTDQDVRLPDGTLAGSNLSLDSAVRNLMRFSGCSQGDAFRAATLTPAQLIGRLDLGAIDVGASADLVVWHDGRVSSTYLRGKRWDDGYSVGQP